MVTFLLICFIAGGFGAMLQGMIGIGTGLVVIPLLSILLPYYGVERDLAMHIALATSMAAITVNSISALISHHRRGNIQWYLFKKMISYSLIGACFGALLASYTSGKKLEITFGLFMLGTAAYMLLKKPIIETTEIELALPTPTVATGGFSIGFIASIIGTGGGTFMVPFLQALKVKMRHAVGTSTLIGLPIALIGTMTYIVTGMLYMTPVKDTFGYLHWPAFLAISSAGILFAPLGARLATTLPQKHLQQVFAICMVVVGLKMIF